MKERKVFLCTECGFDAPKWSGKCPSCGQWNTMREIEASPAAGKPRAGAAASPAALLKMSEVPEGGEQRISTGLAEFDRVLGGGAVCGSTVLLGGSPGVGKSTLLLQACRAVCRHSAVLYVSGEESPGQLKLRAGRLSVDSERLYILAETDMDVILEAAARLNPALLVIDSIQTVHTAAAGSPPGSVAQVKACALMLMQFAKTRGVTVFAVGHINKDGAIAGPKVLEHVVDCVLYFEGERHISYRLLRAAKNRFGSTNEIGVFEMTDTGLAEVENPSEALLSGRPPAAPGSCVACVVEGTRPMLAEIQALVNPTSFGMPRRMAAGIDYNRVALLLAVLEKRAGLLLSDCDAYVNVVGGLRLDEPAVDLPVALAVASSFRDRPVAEGLAAFGELGLTGELRAVSAPAVRLKEIRRLGFSRCILPSACLKGLKAPEGLTLIPARTLTEAIAEALTG